MLTQQQQAAVQSASSKILIRAGAGTGKTEVLTRRAIRLIENEPALTIRNIAIITFTNKATENVKDRLKRHLYEQWRNLQDADVKQRFRNELETLNLAQISTIHQFCLTILDMAGPSVIESGIDYAPGYVVSDSALNQALNVTVECWLTEASEQHPLLKLPIHEVRKFILRAYQLIRNQSLSFEQVLKQTRSTMIVKEEGEIARIKEILIELLKELKAEEARLRINSLNTDHLLEYAAKLLKQSPELVRKVQGRFRHLFVDEFQDTSAFQTEIIKILCDSGPHPCSLFVVGDMKQSIYQFRGADPDSYRNVQSWIASVGEVLHLTVNFRSVQPLVQYVNRTFRRFQVEANLPTFEAEDLEANDQSGGEFSGCVRPVYYAGQSPEQSIVELIAGEIEKGARYQDFAILFRTNRHMDRYEQALRQARIPAQMVGVGNLFERREVSDLYRILNYVISPQDTVKREEALGTELINGNVTLLDVIRTEIRMYSYTHTVAQVIERIMELTEARKMYDNQCNVQASANLERIKELSRSKNQQGIQLVDYVKWLSIQLIANKDTPQADVDDGDLNAVQLITVHKSKGLEFRYVILPELDRNLSSPGLIPQILYHTSHGLEFKLQHPIERWSWTSHAYDDACKAYQREYLAEEARVLYVAMTRAEQRLYLVMNESMKKNRVSYQKWLAESGLELEEAQSLGAETAEDLVFENEPTLGLSQKILYEEHLWAHQRQARDAFMERQHGILEMATGTGKTKTAIDIMLQLLKENLIKNVIITVDGTDLLDQWHSQLLKHTPLKIYRHYDKYKEVGSFTLLAKGALLISRKALDELMPNLTSGLVQNSLFIADEVHGLGSVSKVKKLKGKIKPFRYRLGLSATPERAYDDEGNRFIEEEIGPIIFKFKLEDAISKGILCEFDYYPLDYEFTDGDRAERRKAIATYYAAKRDGKAVSIERLYTELARIKKTARGKLPVFRDYVQANPKVLERSIIFVETVEFGQEVQKIILPLISNYHTYFGDDDRENLVRFSKREIDCLITAKRIAEGIDIRSVHNIILLKADRTRLQTIQQIGRSLRRDPNSPDKRAVVIDFVERTGDNDALPEEVDEWTADQQRRAWLTELSSKRRESL